MLWGLQFCFTLGESTWLLGFWGGAAKQDQRVGGDQQRQAGPRGQRGNRFVWAWGAALLPLPPPVCTNAPVGIRNKRGGGAVMCLAELCSDLRALLTSFTLEL